MLSSDTEQITHGSFGFHEKSDIFAVCPPWMNCEKQSELVLIHFASCAVWVQNLVSHFEEHRLRVFENRVLRKIFGTKREEGVSWRKLHDDELHRLYSSPNIVRVIKSRRMRWAGHVAYMREGRGVYRVLVGRSKVKRPLGRPRHRWEDNIKLDLREIGINVANWFQLAQDRVQWWIL
jgi:hypothetical protein